MKQRKYINKIKWKKLMDSEIINLNYPKDFEECRKSRFPPFFGAFEGFQYQFPSYAQL